MKKSRIAQLISILLKVMLIIGTVCLFFIPKLYDIFGNLFKNQTIYYKLGFYSCAVVSLGVIYELIRVFDIVYEGSPFKKEVEIVLKRIAVLFMILFMIVAIKIIFIPTVLSFSVALIVFVASLGFYVLSQIFKMAIEYKNEVDFTV